jgi:hypothetical protein
LAASEWSATGPAPTEHLVFGFDHRLLEGEDGSPQQLLRGYRAAVPSGRAAMIRSTFASVIRSALWRWGLALNL